MSQLIRLVRVPSSKRLNNKRRRIPNKRNSAEKGVCLQFSWYDTKKEHKRQLKKEIDTYLKALRNRHFFKQSIRAFMKFFPSLLLLCLIHSHSYSRIIEVGPDKAFRTIALAAKTAAPGDTLLLSEGEHAGNNYITGMNGREDAYIYLTSFGNAVIKGSGESIHLTNCSYIHISNIGITAQTANGINIDDDGAFDKPSKHIIIENCRFYDIAAVGNNDMLKMSGVVSSEIRNCVFSNGAAGGSMIDMVGCHNIVIRGCNFENAGSNSIQAKGGSSYVTIHRCMFRNGGLRAINIGGSTGSAYFRPPDAQFESSNIYVYSNVFIGGQSAVAFVGTINSIVCNNTIISPSKWTARILQENNNPDFHLCSYNSFVNNICFFGAEAVSEGGINIGPNTLPNTFAFESNLWFNYDNPNWSNLNNSLIHNSTLTRADPDFKAHSQRDYTLKPSSPAIGAGKAVEEPILDYAGRPFATERSIGAFEGAAPLTAPLLTDEVLDIIVFPNPTNGIINFTTKSNNIGTVFVELFDLSGRVISSFSLYLPTKNSLAYFDFNRYNIPIGAYLLKASTVHSAKTLIVFKVY